MGTYESKTLRLAVLDWGVGGLGLVSELKQRALGCAVVYCSDSGITPYGLVSRSVLLRRMAKWSGFAKANGATHLVIACNAASSALPNSRAAKWCHPPNYELPVTGIIAHGLRAVYESSLQHVGVIGGARTIRSGTYARPLRTGGLTVRQRIAQPLSAFVERSQLHGVKVSREVAKIVAPLRPCDGVLLGCTHYAALQPVLDQALPGMLWLDPVSHLAAWLQDELALSSGQGSIEAWTTGCPDGLRRGAKSAFGLTVNAQKVTFL